MTRTILTSLIALAVLTVLTGIIYPLAVTAIAQVAFPSQANGSMIVSNSVTVGSALIGQPFTDPGHFWGRPSATGPYPYNAGSSSGSNMGQSNPALIDAVKQRVAALKAADPNNANSIPVDLVTASASGLDPHISPAAAEYQISRVAKARGIDEARLRELIQKNTDGRFLGLLGEPGVNVLKLNLALDGR